MNSVQSGGPAAQGIAEKLAEINQKKTKELQSDKKGFQNQVTELGNLETKLKALQTKFEEMEDISNYSKRLTSVGVSENPYLEASATSVTLKGEYKFQIDTLATESKLAGTDDMGSPLSATVDVSGVILSTMATSSAVTNGFFTINGVRIEIHDPATTPTESYAVSSSGSLSDLFNEISLATGSSVTPTYNFITDKVELTSGSEIVLGAGGDTSNVLDVLKLKGNGTGSVSSDLALGATALNGTIDNANLKTAVIAGSHSFKINGVSFSYDPSVDSIKGLMQDINTSAAGADMTYDPTYDKFQIQNKKTGSIGLTVEDTTGNLFEALGLVTGATLTKGVNATFYVNDDLGTPLYSTSNVLDESVHGFEGLSVRAKRVGSDTVTVSQDSGSTKEFLEDFITKYNDVMTFIQLKTKVSSETKEALANNRGVLDIATKMRGFMFSEVTALSGGNIKRLYDIGIDFSGQENQLVINDADKLDLSLRNNDVEVATLFTDSTNGLVKLNKDYVDVQLGDNNVVFKKKTEALNEQIKKKDAAIEKLEKEFKEMEEQQKMMAAQMEAIMGEMDRNAQMIKGLSAAKKS